MTREEKQIQIFLKQYPQFKGRNLRLNIFCDICDDDVTNGECVVARSELNRDLGMLGTYLSYNWELV